MEVIITPDYDTLSRVAASLVADLLNRKPNAVLGLATGSTPLGVYKELVDLYRGRKIDFARVTTFNLDEYVGLPVDHPQSYSYFMRQNLFDHINVPERAIHIIHVVTGTAERMVSTRNVVYVGPGVDVYEGSVIGEHNRGEDLNVNPTREKKLTNIRSSTAEELVRLDAHRALSLDEALELVADDECVEVTPGAVRLRKVELSATVRAKAAKTRKEQVAD